ncbi:hypothetical protein D3C87_599560 [compost metagenome]
MHGFDTFIQEFKDFYLAFHPVLASTMGDHRFDHLLGDQSEAANERFYEGLKDFEARLAEFDPAEIPEDRGIDEAIFHGMLKVLTLEHEEIGWHRLLPQTYLETVLDGVHVLLSRDFAPLPERLSNVLARLKEAPKVLADGKAILTRPARIWTQTAIEVAEGGCAFLDEVVLPLAPQLDGLAEAVAEAKHAITDFRRFLEHELLPRSDRDLGIGEFLYNFKLRHEHHFDLSAEDLLAIGEEARQTTLRQLEETARRIDPATTWQELVERHKDEHSKAEGLLDAYRHEMERARAFVKEKGLATLPEGDHLRVIETPRFIRSVIPYAAYESPGVYEKAQEGLFYVTPVDPTLSAEDQAEQLRGHNRYGVPVTALHEGYPGHHMQLVLANRQDAPIRHLFGNNAYCEGWALYCEEMMYEQGFYPDEVTRLFQLKDVLWRACRVIVDASLQTGRMTFDEAVDFLVDEAKLERINAESEVTWYSYSPAYPMSYLMGKRGILAIREAYQQALGDRFALRDFHDRLLSLGTIPVPLAEAAMLAALG